MSGSSCIFQALEELLSDGDEALLPVFITRLTQLLQQYCGVSSISFSFNVLDNVVVALGLFEQEVLYFLLELLPGLLLHGVGILCLHEYGVDIFSQIFDYGILFDICDQLGGLAVALSQV